MRSLFSMTTTTTTTTTILPRTTPLVVFSRHHHRAVEVDARSGIFACQTTRSSVTGTRTWKEDPIVVVDASLWYRAAPLFFFMTSVCRIAGFVCFLSFFLFFRRLFFFGPFFSGFLPRPPRRRDFSFPRRATKNVRKQNKSRNTFCVLRIY